jgi:hypothetical protein
MTYYPASFCRWTVQVFLGQCSHDDRMGGQKYQYGYRDNPKQIPGNTEDYFLAPNIAFIADYFSHCTTLLIFYFVTSI